MSSKPIVARFCPSPTGYFHIGGARSALFNYLFARSLGGKFILRIEDTDTLRNKPEYDANIVESLAWLNINYDEIYRQSERTEIYKKYLQQLIDEGKAYISQEKIEKEGDRAEVIRFRNPGTTVVMNDLIRGQVEMDTTDLGDFIIAKDLESPIFHFTNIIDDWTMGVTHVIRGEEHLSNTPRHILLLEAFSAPIPTYAHISLILDDSRAKLSKRKHGEFVWIKTYKEQGYLPEAVINYLVLLGWSAQAKTDKNPGTDQEIFTLEELIKLFSLEGIQRSGAIFNIEKLKWFNKEYIKKMPPETQLTELKRYIDEDEDKLKKALEIILDRVNTFKEAKDLYEAGEFDYFFKAPTYAKDLLKNQDHFAKLIELLEGVAESAWNTDAVKTAVWDYATEQGRGNVLWPMRVALSGKEKSADPFTIASVIGKAKTLERLNHAKNL